VNVEAAGQNACRCERQRESEALRRSSHDEIVLYIGAGWVRHGRMRAMTDLATFEELVPLDHGLVVVVTRRPDQTPHAAVVNAGVLPHPTSGEPSVAFVTVGRKLDHLRADPTISVVIRAGWRWVAVDGAAELIGPDDPHPGVDDERLRVLLREIFTAAGGTHDDWDEYDRVMRDERRTAVFVAPTRVYPGSA
jgi:PPOX class probable F420-dependent enzyme